MKFLGSCVAAILAAALVAAAPSTGRELAPAATYFDKAGDAGDAPDITQVGIRPVAGGLAVDVRLARPTELGPYGWILVGLDTDRNPFTGGGRGDELLVLTNGQATTLARWIDGRFSTDFSHQDVDARFSGTDLTFTLARSDLRTRSFVFSVPSLRQDADLAPGFGVARYPRR